MTKEEYLAIAAARYDALKALEQKDNLYDYEKAFDEIWVDLAREVFQASLGALPADRRKKEASGPDTEPS